MRQQVFSFFSRPVFSLVTLAASGGNLLVRALTGGTVDLSGLATVNNPNSRSISVEVTGAGGIGGTVIVGNLIQPRNTRVQVSDSDSSFVVLDNLLLDKTSR